MYAYAAVYCVCSPAQCFAVRASQSIKNLHAICWQRNILYKYYVERATRCAKLFNAPSRVCPKECDTLARRATKRYGVCVLWIAWIFHHITYNLHTNVWCTYIRNKHTQTTCDNTDTDISTYAQHTVKKYNNIHALCRWYIWTIYYM